MQVKCVKVCVCAFIYDTLGGHEVVDTVHCDPYKEKPFNFRVRVWLTVGVWLVTVVGKVR